jgi:cobalt/nickel transport system permease protein
LIANNAFIERTIISALAFLKESVFAEEIAGRKGLLQLIEPRTRVIAILTLILLTLLIKNTRLVWLVYALCLALAVMSQIDLIYFLKRTWIFIPIFSLFIALPSLFSAFTPGEALAAWKIFGLVLTITKPGLLGAVLFVSRVTACVSLAVLLSLTTRHFELLKVLSIFRLPSIYILTLGMCYRFIFVFVETVEHTYLALKSRAGSKLHYRSGQRVVAWNIGNLWLRSADLSEEVFKAMVSRGFNGEAR